MGRLIAFVIGGAAIVFFGAYLLPAGDLKNTVTGAWEDILDAGLLARIKLYGSGVVAGVGLILFAARGSRD